jgi:hypothetical protein
MTSYEEGYQSGVDHWSEEEDSTLILLFLEYGSNWTQLA